MKTQNCIVLLSLLFSVSSTANTVNAEIKRSCAEVVPLMRQKLVDTQRRQAEMKELLERNNHLARASGNPHLVMNLPDFGTELSELQMRVEEMERVCKLVSAIKTNFIGNLAGYEMKSFYQRFSEFMSQMELENVNMTLSEAQKAILLEAFLKMLETMRGLVTYAFEKDPMKRAEFEFGLMTDLDGITTVVIDMLQVDRNGVHDVDTLFERLEAKLSQIRREKEL